MLTELTAHQQNMVAQSAYEKDMSELTDEESYHINRLCRMDLWQHFVSIEAHPEEVHGVYQTLFGEVQNDGSE